MRWKLFVPKWSFLFLPDHSPIAGALHYVFDSGLPLDPWLLRLARGWPRHPPAPGAALAVFAVWAVVFAASVRLLWRAVAGGTAPVASQLRTPSR
jgi:hypothetical protein